MNSKNLFNVKAALLLPFIFITCAATAQEGHRVFNFTPGEQYQTEILTNSRAIVQRGKQTLNINTVSSVNKSYTATLANDRGFTFNVKINRMDTEIDAMGQKLRHNSEVKSDTSSQILKALDFMVNKPVDVQVNKYGVIQTFTDYKAEMATDTLVAFAGLQPEAFERGTLISFIADFTYNPDIKKNYSWSDSVEIDKQRLQTKFWIEDITAKTTIIKFTSKISTKLVNSNQNGTYVVDNATGVIQEKILYTISTGYQIAADGLVYAVSRSTSVSEKTKKTK
ncbi:MAG: hypothetical protein EOO90_10740 [Pedobacter sp.]|nr:MAG: hypothetical protein EOO90_10740 [Pedobacter sp.]